MKLENIETKVDRSKDFVKKQFRIGNTAVILGILRGKLYSNPVKSFTQEIMSNARDAHREIGNEATPIKVKLPSRFDPQFYVRDFGPGISPDRMENVFIAYGCSTKREDDVQTGGFGIGAKSPWAYTDSFGIVTWVPENGKMIKRTYVSIIDESKEGQLNQIDEEESNEPQGTQIIVACKPGDESKFVQWVKNATQFWDVRPEITGSSDFAWPEYNPLFESKKNRWKIYNKDTYTYSKAEPQAIIDGIPYPLNWDNLQLDKMPQKYKNMISNLWYHPVRFFFDTGEMPLTANREEIDYTPQAIDRIHQELIAMLDELQILISDSIKNAKNLWEANLQWKKARSNFQGVIKDVKWNGKTVTGEAPRIEGNHLSVYHYRRKDGNSFRKTHGYGSFSIEENAMLVINDEVGVAEPRRSRLKTLFIDNPNFHSIDVLDLPEDAVKRTAALKFLKDIEIDLYAPTYLLSVVKAKTVRVPGGAGGSTGAQARLYEFVGQKYYKKEEWDRSEEDYTEGEGVYVLLEKKNPYLTIKDSSGKEFTYSFSSTELEKIKNLLKIEIYGVVKRFSDKIGEDWTTLDKAMSEKLTELENDLLVQQFTNIEQEQRSEAKTEFYHLWNCIGSKWQKGITDTNSVIYKYFVSSEDISKVADKADKIRTLKRILENNPCGQNDNKKGSVLAKMAEEVKKTYPMLSMLDTYTSCVNKVQIILDYINMVNKVKEDEVKCEKNEKAKKTAKEASPAVMATA